MLSEKYLHIIRQTNVRIIIIIAATEAPIATVKISPSISQVDLLRKYFTFCKVFKIFQILPIVRTRTRADLISTIVKAANSTIITKSVRTRLTHSTSTIDLIGIWIFEATLALTPLEI